jgi:glycosyltransferase involved in cell wall biosynthesis
MRSQSSQARHGTEIEPPVSPIPAEDIALAYVGTVVPDESEFRNASFSPSGQMYQRELLMSLAEAGLLPSLIVSAQPTPAYPKSARVWIHGREARLPRALQLTLISFLNITPLKQIGIGVLTLLHLLRWGWRTRHAKARVVYTYNLSVPPGLFTLLGARMIRAKAVVSLCDIDVPGETVPSGWPWKLDYWLQKKLIPLFDGHIVAADAMAREFFPGRPYLRLEGGIRKEMFEAGQGRSPAKKLSGGPFVIAATGLLNEANGFHVLLEAFALLKGERYRLRIAGRGPLEAMVRESAANDSRIEYLGFLSFEGVLDAYAQSDVLINMRLTERLNTKYFFPAKMMEYLASGTPVITTCTGHTEEEFSDFVFLLREETPQGLAAVIQQVAEMHPVARRTAGHRARDYMFAHKTWDAQAGKVVRFIGEVVLGVDASRPALARPVKPRILICADWYLPGAKGGGSVSAISNLIAALGDDFQFYVITRDHDNTEDHPYASVCSDRWVTVGKAEVLYTSDLSFQQLRRRVLEIGPEIIYLNSFFSRFTSKMLLLRRAGLLPPAPVVLAPRGEFSPGALALKPFRKWLYRKLAFSLGLYRDLAWQASSLLEKQHIRSLAHPSGDIGDSCICVAPDFPSANLTTQSSPHARLAKARGTVRLIFLSRIARKKNVHFALEMLGGIRGEVDLAIYGPVEDSDYWEQCREFISRLPKNVRVDYRGPVPPGQVLHAFTQFHFQILPTLGENFGYAILESLAAGCPVVTSDQTPWRNLPAQGLGWDLPLEDSERWLEILQECVDLDQTAYEVLSRRCQAYVQDWLRSTPYRSATIDLFHRAMDRCSTFTAPRGLPAPVERRD